MYNASKSSLICLFLSLCNGFSMGCRWIDERQFIMHSASSLGFLDIMGEDIPKDSVKIFFPEDLYKQADCSPADDQIWFILQTLDEITKLFSDKCYSVWGEKTVDNFLGVLSSQVDGLQSCITSQKKRSKNLHKYFKRLNNDILKSMEYSPHAWEMVRKEVRTHLKRLTLLGSAPDRLCNKLEVMQQ
ncbi:interferon phi 4 [Esox lucius]|uniref:Uncharacterized protein n=1 Tax=Esox lucius TaxID=8010 RepID=A0A6Q2XHG3_ESOLU|nr:interferon phi 4 [Esox lucius]